MYRRKIASESLNIRIINLWQIEATALNVSHVKERYRQTRRVFPS